MNTDQIKGKWQQFKGDLQKTFGKITDDEWEKTKGEINAVSGLVQAKYGQTKEEISGKVSELYDKHMGSANQDDQSDGIESTEDTTTVLRKMNDKSDNEKSKHSEI